MKSMEEAENVEKSSSKRSYSKEVLVFLLSICSMAFMLQDKWTWTPLTSNVTATLRGVSAVSSTAVWASGSANTILRSTDGGTTWARTPTGPSADRLDFRDVDAIDERTAYVLSIGDGPLSRIFKTTDGGATWVMQFVNEDPKAFFDAMAFWDANRGIAVSDSVDGQFVIIQTTDGGRAWTRVPADRLPPALQ